MYRRPGFTLLELIIVLAIVGTLAAMALPRFGGSLANYRMERSADQVVRDLQAARELAHAASTTVSVTFDPTGDAYAIPAMTHPDHPGQTFLRSLAADPYAADIVGADFDGDVTVTFDGYGLADLDGYVTVAVGDQVRYVHVLAATGSVFVREVLTGDPPGGVEVVTLP